MHSHVRLKNRGFSTALAYPRQVNLLVVKILRYVTGSIIRQTFTRN